MPRPMVTKQLRNPQALSSTLAVLGMLQPRALEFLNCLVTLVSASNYYVVVLVDDVDGTYMTGLTKTVRNSTRTEI